MYYSRSAFFFDIIFVMLTAVRFSILLGRTDDWKYDIRLQQNDWGENKWTTYKVRNDCSPQSKGEMLYEDTMIVEKGDFRVDCFILQSAFLSIYWIVLCCCVTWIRTLNLIYLSKLFLLFLFFYLRSIYLIELVVQ